MVLGSSFETGDKEREHVNRGVVQGVCEVAVFCGYLINVFKAKRQTAILGSKSLF